MSSTKACTGIGLVCSKNPSQVTLENRLNSATLTVQIRAMQSVWDALFKLRFVRFLVQLVCELNAPFSLYEMVVCYKPLLFSLCLLWEFHQEMINMPMRVTSIICNIIPVTVSMITVARYQ